MFKVGDRVKCINNKSKIDGKIFDEELKVNNIYVVKKVEKRLIEVTNDFRYEGGYFADRFELVEEDNMRELTFREVIAEIKEGEVWEYKKDEYFNMSIEKTNNCIVIHYPQATKFHHISDLMKFKIQRKQYTFTEAFAEYEKGKEIESCGSKNRYKKINGNSCIWWEQGQCFENETYFRIDEINNKWYIN